MALITDPLKLKRQVRDFFNKRVHDEKTIKAVAKVIGFNKGSELALRKTIDQTWEVH